MACTDCRACGRLARRRTQMPSNRGCAASTLSPSESGSAERSHATLTDRHEFHRWVRDRDETLGLINSAAFGKFIQERLISTRRGICPFRRAAETLTSGLQAIHYNAQNAFFLHTGLACTVVACRPRGGHSAQAAHCVHVSGHPDGGAFGTGRTRATGRFISDVSARHFGD